MLHSNFVKADALERTSTVNQQAFHQLKLTLLEKMHRLGDDVFAEQLAKENDEVQTSVGNCIGLLQNSKYDAFPKTRYVLSAAPKI